MKINVEQILSEAVSVYKKYFKKLIGISLSQSFILLLSLLVYARAIVHMLTATINSGRSLLFVLGMPMVMIFALILMIKLHLAMPILINSIFDNNIMTTKHAFLQTKGRFWRMVSRSILIGIFYLPAIAITYTNIPFISVIGTIYIAFISSLFYTLSPMIAIEPKTNRYLRKSIKMIKGNYIPILSLTLITVTALSVLNGVFTNIFQSNAIELLIVQITYIIVNFFVSPFAGITKIIVYRQLKSNSSYTS